MALSKVATAKPIHYVSSGSTETDCGLRLKADGRALHTTIVAGVTCEKCIKSWSRTR
jgi:hypothetical protein